MRSLLEPFVENPIITVVVLVCIVLLFAIINSPQDEWMLIGRKLGLVIGGLIVLTLIFGLVLQRTLS